MGRKEDLLKIVEANQDKREQDQEALRLLNGQWEEARDKVIRPRLTLAAKSLDSVGAWSVGRDNGDVFLCFEPSIEPQTPDDYFGGREHKLSFSKDELTRKIICHCSVQDIKESFDVTSVTWEEVDRKIDEFVKAVT